MWLQAFNADLTLCFVTWSNHRTFSYLRVGEKQAELGPPDVSSRGRGRANPTAKGKWAVKIPTGCAHQHDSHSQEPPATQNYSFPVEFHLLITDLQEMGPHFTGGIRWVKKQSLPSSKVSVRDGSMIQLRSIPGKVCWGLGASSSWKHAARPGSKALEMELLQKKPTLTPCWKVFLRLAFSCCCYYNHKGLSQRTLPLGLAVKVPLFNS